MEKLFLPWQRCHKRNGFLLIELVLSVFVLALFASLIVRGFGQMAPSWVSLSKQTSMFDVGHYMLSILEKNLAYEAKLITIKKQKGSNDKLICETIFGNTSYIFFCEGQYIKKTIKKNKDSGTIPLYVSTCKVTGWQLTRLNEQELLVEISLLQDNKTCTLARIFYCLNGRIEVDAAS